MQEKQQNNPETMQEEARITPTEREVEPAHMEAKGARSIEEDYCRTQEATKANKVSQSQL